MIEVQRRIINIILNEDDTLKNKIALSLGCGLGNVERIAAPFFDKIIGIDLSKEAIDKANNLAEKYHITNLQFIVGDVCKIYFNESFDIILALGLLHHLNDQEIIKLLVNIFVNLKSEGIFYAVDPYKYRFVGIFKLIFSKLYNRYHSPDERELDFKSLIKLLYKIGFKKVSVIFVDFFLGPVAWAFPNCPDILVPIISKIDTFLLKMPFLNNLGSSYCIIAKK